MQKQILIPTKDNYVVVMNIDYNNSAELARKTAAAKIYISSHIYNEIADDMCNKTEPFYSQIAPYIDGTNTQFLHDEIKNYPYVRRRSEYKNLTTHNHYSGPLPDLFKNIDYSIPDNIVPEVVKSLGYTISVADVLCKVTYNKKTNSYDVIDNWASMDISPASRRIRIFRKNFKLPDKDDQRLKQLMQIYRTETSACPDIRYGDFAQKHLADTKDRALFDLYFKISENVKRQHLLFYHEVKHLQNKLFTDSFYLNKGNIRLSVGDYYKLNVEDERTAYISQVINGVNEYLKRGNYNDFSMFDGESNWLVEKLKKMSSPTERKNFVRHLPNLINGEIENFNKIHFDKYKKDFENQTEFDIKSSPLAADEDKNHEQFKKIQRQYYLFQIYNPDTGRMEYKNLFDCISEENQAKGKFLPKLNILMQKKLFVFSQNKSKYDLSLINRARRIIYENSRSSGFVSPEESLSISSFSAQPHPQPNVPDDKADWSDELQKYWQKFEGYQKINKNNYEYSFKIKDDVIRYTDRNNVELGKETSYETYVKLLNEPTNRDKPIIFKNTLSKEQALYLYIACILQNRTVKGNVPSDLKDVDKLKGIPPADLAKFKSMVNPSGKSQPTRAAHSLPIFANSRIRDR